MEIRPGCSHLTAGLLFLGGHLAACGMKRRDFLKSSFAGMGLPVLFPALYLKDSSPVCRFAVASDGHYGQPGTAYTDDFANLNHWIKKEKKKKGLDLIILNGDLFHDDPVFLPAVRQSFDQLPVPYYVTRGNHDRVSEQVWKQTWGYLPDHDFTWGDYAFILTDTSNEKGEYLCANVTWLQTTLQKYTHTKGIFVFMHIPPSKRWTDSGVDCQPIRELLEKTPNVAAVFHGHDHDLDGKKTSGNKPYFFDGHFGGNWGTAYKGYRIVEIYGDGTWYSYQYNPTASPLINAYTARRK